MRKGTAQRLFSDTADLFAEETPAGPLEPNFKNRTIWTGDNLHILRGLNSACVDLIYLDPPFNSNRTYSAPIGSEAAGAAFKDAWTKDDLDIGWHGEIADREPALHAVLRAAELTDGTSLFAYLVMMGIRLIELRRILKPAGTIWLHCDDAASHWLRVLMDSLFGKSAFQNVVVWKRIGNHNDAGRFGRTADHLLFYGSEIQREGVRVPLSSNNVAKYRRTDRRGRYTDKDLTGPGTSDGESGQPWRDWNPTAIGRCWSVPKTGNYAAWIEAELIPRYRTEPSILRRLELLDSADLVIFTRNGTPRLKHYLHANPGQVPSDVWTDIPPVNSQAKERTNYPTQKPLALLDRIIQAGSTEGDLVLDPFCGCATTCVAAELAGRQWAGIDLSPMAVHLLRKRLEDHAKRDADLFRRFDPIVREDIPKREDINDPSTIGSPSDKHILYGQQEGRCNGCRVHFPFRNMTVDHKTPTAHGGHDGIANKQLLCGACNSTKGTRTQAHLVAKLKERGILT